MDNASDADLQQVAEDPEDAPLVDAAANEPRRDDDDSEQEPHDPKTREG